MTAPATSREARRVELPSWTDTRLLVGVLLVLGSVVLGTRVVSAAQQTHGVWTAARDLPGGVTLRADDVVLEQVRLDDASGHYLEAGATVVGRPLQRSVSAGELLPASSLGPLDGATPVHLLAVPVEGTHLPPRLERGSVVDVYVTPHDASGSGGAATAQRVLAGATVADTDDGEGGLRDPQSTVTVVLAVPDGAVADLVSAVRSGDVDLVLVAGG